MITRATSQNKFKNAEADIATNIRQTRSYEYFILDQTNFESLRSEYLSNADRIRNMRLIEHLGRYTPKTVKEMKVAQFKGFLAKVLESLEGMKAESLAYKQLVSRNTYAKSDQGPNLTHKDEQQSFRETVKRNIKEVENTWVEIFNEGSLKRLIQVLILLQIEDQNINTHINIPEWARLVEANLCVSIHKSPKCCWLL